MSASAHIHRGLRPCSTDLLSLHTIAHLGWAQREGRHVVGVPQEEVLVVDRGALVHHTHPGSEVDHLVLGRVEEVLGAVLVACGRWRRQAVRTPGRVGQEGGAGAVCKASRPPSTQAQRPARHRPNNPLGTGPRTLVPIDEVEDEAGAGKL